MTTIPNTRAELALMVPDMGVFIELGVAAGKSAEAFLEANPFIEYIGIDRWSDHHNEQEMEQAKRIIFSRNGSIIRSTFADAVFDIADEYADLIYVDGYAHTGQEGGETLEQWWPKLKPGGIFSGHDYDSEYPQTVAAVDAFVQRHGLELNVIIEKPNCSWWVKKPA